MTMMRRKKRLRGVGGSRLDYSERLNGKKRRFGMDMSKDTQQKNNNKTPNGDTVEMSD